MLKRVISAVIGSRHERERKKIQPIVDEINEQYERLHRVSDEELRRTAVYRIRIAEWSGKRKQADPDFPGAYFYEDVIGDGAAGPTAGLMA